MVDFGDCSVTEIIDGAFSAASKFPAQPQISILFTAHQVSGGRHLFNRNRGRVFRNQLIGKSELVPGKITVLIDKADFQPAFGNILFHLQALQRSGKKVILRKHQQILLRQTLQSVICPEIPFIFILPSPFLQQPIVGKHPQKMPSHLQRRSDIGIGIPFILQFRFHGCRKNHLFAILLQEWQQFGNQTGELAMQNRTAVYHHGILLYQIFQLVYCVAFFFDIGLQPGKALFGQTAVDGLHAAFLHQILHLFFGYAHCLCQLLYGISSHF